MRQATIAKAQTRPWSTRVGRILRYCTTWVFLILVTVVGMLSPLLANTDTAIAATNETVNFQARILQASGALVPDGNYNVEFKIYDSPSSGATGQGVCSLNSSTDDCWWLETRTGANVVRVVNGYVSVNLGSVTPFGASIPWDQELYITMRVGGIGGPVWDTEMVNLSTGRMKLNAAPYAKIAGGLRTTNGVNSTNVTFATPTASNTITFGDGSGLVCLNNGNCNGTGGGYLLFGSSTIQNGTSSNELIRANQQGSGGLANLQSAGTTRFSIGNDGLTTIASGVRIGTTTSAVAGTIRWTGTDYEGYDGVQWRSLTAGAAVTPFAAKTKTINEVQNNIVNPTAALQPDDQLFFPVGANETWNFRFDTQIIGNATPDIKFSVTGPAGATCVVSVADLENAVTVSNLGCGVSTGILASVTATDGYVISGTVTNGATAGNVTLNWAQNTANAANVTMLSGSFLEAQRTLGGDSADVAYIQGGNSFGATAVLGTNDNNAISILTNGTEKIRVDASGNVGIGDGTPAALFTVGTADAFQVNASGNILTSGTLSVTGTTTLTGNLLANNSATGVTGTTSGTGTSTTTLVLSADVFAVNDVVLIDNAGQDYYTRVTVDPGTGSYTVSPAVTFENARTVTKYNIQNIGASATDYTTRTNRFFQGYFLGGITVGAGSTTLADGVLERSTGDIVINPGAGGVVNVNGTLNATTITGDGSSITNIDGSSVDGATVTGIDAGNISTGTLNDGRLSSNVALLNGTQSYSALQTFTAGVLISSGQTLSINGEGFSDITGTGLSFNAGSLEVLLGTTVDGSEIVDASVALDDLADNSVNSAKIVDNSVTGTDVAAGTITNSNLVNSGITITAGAGLSGGGSVSLGSSTSISVAYGSTAGTAVEGNTTITCPTGTGNLTGGGNTITLGAGGSCGALNTSNAVTFSTSTSSPLFTGAGAVTLSSGGAGDLALDSASNVLIMSDATWRRVAAGTTTLELNDAANTTLSLTNTNGVGVANFSVEGTVTATGFSGSGANLTALNGSNISSGTVADARLSTNVTLAGNSFNGINQLVRLDGSGALPALSGAGLTALNATNISTGTLSDGRLSSNVALLTGTQTFSGAKTFGAGATITSGQTLTIGGKSFSDIQGAGLALNTGVLSVAYGSTANTAVQGNTGITITAGNGLSGGGAITLGAGGTVTLNVAYGSTTNTAVQGNTTLTCPTGTGNLTGGGTSITLGTGGTCGAISTNNAVAFTTSVTTPLLTSTGAIELRSGGANTVTIDAGGAAGVTIAGTNASSLALGRSGIDVTINGTTLVLGTSTIRRTAAGITNFELNDGANTTLNITNTNGSATANVTVEGDISATNVSGAGAGLTALNATNVATGTLGDARLSANVTRLNTSQTFSAGQTFSSGLTISAGQAVSINGESFSDLTGTGLVLSGSALAIDTTYFNANYIQLGSASLQTDATNNATIGVNKTSATGNLITLQRSGVAAFTVANTGALQIRATSTTGLDIQTGGGVSTFSVDTSGNIVRVGQATLDATGVVLVLDSKSTAGDPTGVEGAMYFNDAQKLYRCYRAGTWENCSTNAIERSWEMSDEFMSGYTGGGCTTATAIIGDQNWTCFTNGAATTAYNIGTILPSVDRPGIIRMTTAAANGNGFTMALAGNNTGSVVIAPGNRVKTTVGQGATITNNILRVGLHAQTTTNAQPTTGVWWEADATTNANWRYCYGTGAAATCAATTVPITASTLYSLDIQVISTGAGTSSARFMINGTVFNVTNVTIGTATRVNPAISCYNSAAGARECFVDYYQFSGTSAARR
jgi:fibronectin-binding autotransporter adhesin